MHGAWESSQREAAAKLKKKSSQNPHTAFSLPAPLWKCLPAELPAKTPSRLDANIVWRGWSDRKTEDHSPCARVLFSDDFCSSIVCVFVVKCRFSEYKTYAMFESICFIINDKVFQQKGVLMMQYACYAPSSLIIGLDYKAFFHVLTLILHWISSRLAQEQISTLSHYRWNLQRFWYIHFCICIDTSVYIPSKHVRFNHVPLFCSLS